MLNLAAKRTAIADYPFTEFTFATLIFVGDMLRFLRISSLLGFSGHPSLPRGGYTFGACLSKRWRRKRGYASCAIASN